MFGKSICICFVIAWSAYGCSVSSAGGDTASGSAQYAENPFVIELDIPAPADSAGGIIAADLNSDGLIDYLVTVRGHIAAYDHNGGKQWIIKHDLVVGGSSESSGLPGHNGPGVQAADIDDDGTVEVLYLTRDSVLHVVAGPTGKELWTAKPPHPDQAAGWEHLVVADFRGGGDRDILLQTTNLEGYRIGRYLAAYSLDDLKQTRYSPLWSRDDFIACAHNGARIADLDGDSIDEVLGGTIISHAGRILVRIPLRGHIDSIFVDDIRPDIPGLEVLALEEGGGNRIFLYNSQKLLWETHHHHREPQNAAIGRFDLDRNGLLIWCRSRYDRHQKPFLFDAFGKFIRQYEMDTVKPAEWTDKGVEVINKIDWTGDNRQLAAAKERHRSGDVAVFDPLSGKFIHRVTEKADRLYVADVSGDWREELIVLNGNQLHIYHNDKPNPQPDRPRLWNQPHYRRSKMTWNYYSP